jgi:hypothetical protein
MMMMMMMMMIMIWQMLYPVALPHKMSGKATVKLPAAVSENGPLAVRRISAF